MDENAYNIGTGLIDISATTVNTDYLICDDVNSQTGVIKLNFSSLSNVQSLFSTNVVSSNITSCNLRSSNITSCNVNASNITTCNLIAHENVWGNNLHTSNLILYRGDAILESDQKIDYKKWIKNGPQVDDSGVIVIPPVVLPPFFGPPPVPPVPNPTGDGEGYDPGYNEDAVYVHWNHVIHPPIFKNINDLRIGFGSNIYVENKSKIYGLNKLEFLSYDDGKFKRIANNLESDDMWYDFETKTMYLDTIHCSSNIYTSNIESSNATLQNISASTMSCPVIATSNIEAYNVWAYDTLYGFDINSSNISSSNVYASNVDTRDLYAVNASFSNVSVAFNLNSSNINSSNVYASNIDTRNLLSSNITCSNLFSEFLRGTSMETTTANVAQTLFSDNAVIKTVSGTDYVKSGNLFLTPTGLKRNLFGIQTPIIDVAGKYVGEISLSQIKDLSSLNLEQLMDGKCQVKSVAEPDFDFVLFNPFADIRW